MSRPAPTHASVQAPTPGAAIGILMLDTNFTHLPGDIGHARTWDFPVRYRVVRGASPERVVHGPSETLLQPFLLGAQELVANGVRGVTTSCGFLALLQREMAAALPVPVAASSLLQAPVIEAMLPAGQQVGILTFAAEALTSSHLRAVGVRTDTKIHGFAPGSAFRRVYGGLGSANPAELEAEAVAAAAQLLDGDARIGAILCECTNLAPHAAAIAAATGRPVFDINGFIEWFARSLVPPRYPPAGACRP